MSILKAYPPRDIVLSGGPFNGTKMNQFHSKEIHFEAGCYRSTGNVVNEREVFEWEAKEE